MQTQCECKCSQEVQWVMRPIFMHFSSCQAPGEPARTHTYTHWLAARKGVSVGVWKRCQQMLQPHTFKSSILFFFFLFFLLPSLSLLRDPPTPSAGILLWVGSLSQHSNAPVCSCISILSDLLPFRMDQAQVKRCAASLIRTVLMQNKVHGHAQDHLNTMNLYDISVYTLKTDPCI